MEILKAQVEWLKSHFEINPAGLLVCKRTQGLIDFTVIRRSSLNEHCVGGPDEVINIAHPLCSQCNTAAPMPDNFEPIHRDKLIDVTEMILALNKAQPAP